VLAALHRFRPDPKRRYECRNPKPIRELKLFD
jgi:hypothetical protein